VKEGKKVKKEAE